MLLLIATLRKSWRFFLMNDVNYPLMKLVRNLRWLMSTIWLITTNTCIGTRIDTQSGAVIFLADITTVCIEPDFDIINVAIIFSNHPQRLYLISSLLNYWDIKCVAAYDDIVIRSGQQNNLWWYGPDRISVSLKHFDTFTLCACSRCR